MNALLAQCWPKKKGKGCIAFLYGSSLLSFECEHFLKSVMDKYKGLWQNITSVFLNFLIFAIM